MFCPSVIVIGWAIAPVKPHPRDKQAHNDSRYEFYAELFFGGHAAILTRFWAVPNFQEET